jgi:hypothetical protein
MERSYTAEILSAAQRCFSDPPSAGQKQNLHSAFGNEALTGAIADKPRLSLLGNVQNGWRGRSTGGEVFRVAQTTSAVVQLPFA